MRAFIVLCLVAVACADKLGYNYHPVGHSEGGLSFLPGGGSVGGGPSDGGIGNLGGLIGGRPSGGIGSSGGFDGGSSGGPAGGSDGAGGDGGLGDGEGELEKEFFTYTANDEDFGEPEGADQLANSLKRNLRVIFIKGPDNNGLEKAALNLAKHSSEQKTAIYVLTKQADIGDLAHKLQAVHDQHSSKPEVHFVKYRTPEDAANAQHAIQSQYDSLGGTSQSHDGGVAPVHNFASPGAQHGGAQNGGGQHGSYNAGAQQGGGIAGPSSTYLPASIFRRFRL